MRQDYNNRLQYISWKILMISNGDLYGRIDICFPTGNEA